ncbi:MAG TPA: hypothetical protein VJT09_08940 [Pyrinomonadaceae bacterium]|nr:hypothetical protein [Pyrinomonadaceae bacterium]
MSETSFVLRLAAVVALILLPAGAMSGRAQSPTRNPTIEERQVSLRGVKRENPKSPEAVPVPNPAYEQSKEDFETLQVINGRLAGVARSNLEPDYWQVGKEAAELRKRAARLRVNLLLPEPEKSAKDKKREEALAHAPLKSAIDFLNSLIKRFVENPVFQQPNVLDVEHSVRARLDLEEIIRLSELIQKRAAALSKATGK